MACNPFQFNPSSVVSLQAYCIINVKSREESVEWTVMIIINTLSLWTISPIFLTYYQILRGILHHAQVEVDRHPLQA